jgi:hypothetical protein
VAVAVEEAQRKSAQEIQDLKEAMNNQSESVGE